ncbi:hypothetical protein E4U61_000239 [Claviceps capensis]|nr:hypothetical protein E4U61_000239 [Claviceps capensis]
MRVQGILVVCGVGSNFAGSSRLAESVSGDEEEGIKKRQRAKKKAVVGIMDCEEGRREKASGYERRSGACSIDGLNYPSISARMFPVELSSRAPNAVDNPCSGRPAGDNDGRKQSKSLPWQPPHGPGHATVFHIDKVGHPSSVGVPA